MSKHTPNDFLLDTKSIGRDSGSAHYLIVTFCLDVKSITDNT